MIRGGLPTSLTLRLKAENGSSSSAQEIPNQTEPNAQENQGNDLQFESLEQEERQQGPNQRDCIELLETNDP
jgi:hypothetical protein